MPEEIIYFEYDGHRLPVVGEWYGYQGYDGYGIYRSVIDFEQTPQHIYRPVYENQESVGFDEWNW